ncbi:sensor domain-containing diguanylate cyclase [Pseudotabrizicola sp. 4114]|uniref:sensor domain-containing diguanylate cyclase n=1 Tax=Pseudotabrizicola sp. 4114 TaxID=2817731 RepID=UPI00285D55C9|nr:diguanylate cyclase (GGDEF)-like protein [Pseudorhodobacter sp. 4114]
MRTDRQLTDEAGRLAALRRYDVLDTPAEEPFEKLTELVRNVLSVPIAAVSLIDEKRQWFKSIAGLSACETTRDVSFCAHAIKRREPMVVPDATLDIRFADNPFVTSDPFIRSYLGIPLETPDGYNLGALCAIDLKPRSFSGHEIAILTSFAKLVVNELELRQIANSDVLTGAMTRRGWVAACEKELERSRRYDTAASIILFDVDHFKGINDSHGHPAGDEVLRVMVQRCLATLRDSDSIGRIGGEEFAILLPATDAAGAIDLAERLRRQFADSPVIFNGAQLRVTASFGISSRTSAIKDVDAWLAAADALLYQAKAGGRNRCKASTEPSMSVCR